MRKFSLFFLTVLVGIVSNLHAQELRRCGAAENLERQLLENPALQQSIDAIEHQTQQYASSQGSQERVVITIPVVFHIIHNGDAVGSGENISDTYINAQLDQLNKDFRKLNADASLIPAAFASVAADAEIQFCLAQRKPDGTATNGINRLNMGNASWTMNQCESTLKPQTIWDRSKYLNLWTVVFGGSDAGTLGYAQFPGGAANTDGVVLLYSSVGSTSTPNSAGGAYGKGRTATHEVGHWLNLRHIWGDATCGTDYVSDTPTHNTANYGCPTYPHASTCSGAPTEMTMNYMDYTDDACMYMFSAGQKTRMQALFAASGSRASLATSNGCTAPSGGGTTTCGTPASLASSSITSSSATVSWGAVSGASSYTLQYKLSSASTWTSVSTTSTSYSLTGLTASSTYNFQVSATCSSTAGSYSTTASFTTSAASGGGGSTGCSDTYESNNSKTASKTIPTNSAITAFIGTSTDIDWYKFTTTSTAKNVRVTLSNLPLDYDMTLYRGSSTIGTSQNGGTTSEQLKYNSSTTATYYVKVYGYNGAYSATSCYTLLAERSNTAFRTEATDALAVEKVKGAEFFDITPNPINDIAKIQMPMDDDANITVTVFDILGKQVLKQTMLLGQNQTIDLNFSDVANGMYIVRVDDGQTSSARKIMVNH